MPLPIVCIAGGGTAGLEALLAARELLGDRVELRLVSPKRQFRYRAMPAGRPLVPAPEHATAVAALAADTGAEVLYDRVVEVRDADRALLTRDGDLVDFDYLLLATGARGERVLEQGDVWERGRDPVVLDETLEMLASSSATRAGVVIPCGARWPLPAYELALVMGWSAVSQGQVTLVTAEQRPLGVLGHAATELVTSELRDAGVELITGVEALDDSPAARGMPGARLRLLTEEPASDGAALTARPTRRPSEEELGEIQLFGGSGRRWRRVGDEPLIVFDRLISLPTVTAPRIGGTASDAAGFIVVDERLKMLGSERVWGAGSCLASGLEHSALAAQQADSAIAEIGAAIGLDAPAVEAPELTGILLSGQRDRWLMSNPRGTRQPSTRCLWWPTGRAVGPRLARRIAALDPAVQGVGVADAPPGLAVRVHVVLGDPIALGTAVGTDDAELRKSQQREIEQRQLMAVERRERAAAAELRTLNARLRDFDAEMKAVVGQLKRAGYLQRDGGHVVRTQTKQHTDGRPERG